MTSENSKKWQKKEEERLIKYQHQHRGLSFIKLLLPQPDDKKVNLVGVDNHIYRGSIAKLPEDQLPPDVDEKSIDEEALYEEIRNFNFPPVPRQEPLGPSRRIGGEYTLSRRLHLAPIKVNLGELQEVAILGKDGGVYRGTVKFPSKLELDRQLRGSKKPIQKVRKPSSSRGFIEPTLVVLQTAGQPPLPGRPEKSSVEIPASNVGKIIELVVSKNKRNKDKDLGKDIQEDLSLSQNKDETKPEETEKAEKIDESSVSERDVSKELSSTETGEPESTRETDESEDVKASESSKVDDESGNRTETEFADAKDANEFESSIETEEIETQPNEEGSENLKDINESGSEKETEGSSTSETEESWTTKETEESQSKRDSEET